MPRGVTATANEITATVTAIAILIATSFRFVGGFETRQNPNPRSVEAKPGAEFLADRLLQPGVYAERHQHR
jgi:hypothetical protein